ncbi:MAG: DNA methylase [Candidatus Yanofskybacteria bacterium]|nr:DNA methylase [Candidatus Yanofskybacteria bacterium]
MKLKKIYSKDLGIDLESRKEREAFKWLVACFLFGNPISQEIAAQAWGELEQEGLMSPDALLKAGWERIVRALDRGKYGRYDESTATRLLDAADLLKKKYQGSMLVFFQRVGRTNLVDKLQEEFKGIGPISSRIFMRDMEKWFFSE